MSNLLGIKKILTYKLINIIRPFIYEGILSIYLDAENISQEDEILMVFQGLLSRIPKWSDTDIIKEVTRIESNSNCLYLVNLMRSLIKINIQIFLEETKDTYVEPNLYEKITLKDYIHQIYILVARRIFNNPILFYKELKDIDVLNNMNKVMNIIGEEMRNAVIELLPLDYLIDEYLNEEIYNKQLNLKIPNESVENLQQMKKKINMLDPINDIRIKIAEGPDQENQRIDPHQFPIIPIQPQKMYPTQMGGEKRKGSRRSSRSTSSRRRSSNSSRRKKSSSRRRSSRRRSSSSRQRGGRKSSYSRNSSSDRIEKNVKKFLDNSKRHESSMIDNIIKNKHKEAINIKHDPETSASYDIDNANNFQEIFSNDKEIRRNTNLININKKNVKFSNVSDNHLFTSNKKNIGNNNYRKIYKV